MLAIKHRVVYALVFLAAVTSFNVAFQYVGFTPGLIVAESSSACRYFKAGLVDWRIVADYSFFVGTLLFSFVLAMHAAEKHAAEKSDG